jgi:hypothetical protein
VGVVLRGIPPIAVARINEVIVVVVVVVVVVIVIDRKRRCGRTVPPRGHRAGLPRATPLPPLLLLLLLPPRTGTTGTPVGCILVVVSPRRGVANVVAGKLVGGAPDRIERSAVDVDDCKAGLTRAGSAPGTGSPGTVNLMVRVPRK